MLKILACLSVAVCASAQAPVAEVTSVGNFIHIVSDLDKSVAFYRDVIGMELQRPLGPGFTDSPEVAKMYNAVGGKYRAGNMQAAGSPMRMELEQWQGVERKPVRPKVSDAGASLLIATVRQLEPVLARIKEAGSPLVSVRGEPVNVGPDLQAITVADPDGYFVVVEAKRGTPAAAAGESNIIGLRFGYVVSALSLMKGSLEALGLKPVLGSLSDKDTFRPLLNTNGAIARMTVPMPGVNWAAEFFEIRSGPSSKDVALGTLPNPGAPVLRLVVKDADVTVRALKATGAKVASAGGEVVVLPGGKAQLHAAIVSLRDNLFVQVLQQ